MGEEVTIAKEFQVHMLNEQGKELARKMAAEFSNLLYFCQSVGQPGRELALVATHLEQACFFAKKAMAQKPDNQQ